MNKKRVVLKEQTDIVAARQAGREMARQLGFGSANQTRLATAISELVRNALQYAGEGVCLIHNADQGQSRGRGSRSWHLGYRAGDARWL